MIVRERGMNGSSLGFSDSDTGGVALAFESEVLRGNFFSQTCRSATFLRTMQNQIAVSLLGVLILGALLPCGVVGGVEFKSGQPFPDIVLPKLSDGKPGAISQFRGKKLLLHIFASW